MAMRKRNSGLHAHTRYLQVALNGTLEDARDIIMRLPRDRRLLVEAGTPLIKRYGEDGIRRVAEWWGKRLGGHAVSSFAARPDQGFLGVLLDKAARMHDESVEEVVETDEPRPYVIADLKTIDRGGTEARIASRAGASAAVAMGSAPAETLNAFIAECEAEGIDAFVDMMNVESPVNVLRSLRMLPRVVVLHRGVDEERDNKSKTLPLHEIRRIKGNFDMLIAVAGGDSVREVQRASFNDADIVVVWKNFLEKNAATAELAAQFLKEMR